MIKPIKTSKKVSLVVLLFFFSLGSFGLFAGTELNIFLKVYGLLILLQGGFALVYLGLYRSHQH